MRNSIGPIFGASPVVEAAMHPRSTALLLKNSQRVLQDFLFGKIHDISSFKNNAFIASSAVQVTSRIAVANDSAKKSKGTPEGPLRFTEAAKTTMRELLGFTLSYLVLRKFQYITTDFFKNMLWVTKGLDNTPTFLNNVFRRYFKVPQAKLIAGKSHFPDLAQTLRDLYRHTSDYFKGNLQKIDLTPLEKLFPDEVAPKGIYFDPSRQYIYNKYLEKPVNLVHKLAGHQVTDPMANKLITFFNWVPPIVGSIPAILLSGYWLEKFSQEHGEDVARKVAGLMRKNKGFAPTYRPMPQMMPPTIPPHLAQRPLLPYANGEMPHMMQAGTPQYGYPLPFTPQPPFARASRVNPPLYGH